MVYTSKKEAQRVAARYRRENPSGKYVIRAFALGNRVSYEIVDVARFG